MKNTEHTVSEAGYRQLVVSSLSDPIGFIFYVFAITDVLPPPLPPPPSPPPPPSSAPAQSPAGFPEPQLPDSQVFLSFLFVSLSPPKATLIEATSHHNLPFLFLIHLNPSSCHCSSALRVRRRHFLKQRFLSGRLPPLAQHSWSQPLSLSWLPSRRQRTPLRRWVNAHSCLPHLPPFISPYLVTWAWNSPPAPPSFSGLGLGPFPANPLEWIRSLGSSSFAFDWNIQVKCSWFKKTLPLVFMFKLMFNWWQLYYSSSGQKPWSCTWLFSFPLSIHPAPSLLLPLEPPSISSICWLCLQNMPWIQPLLPSCCLVWARAKPPGSLPESCFCFSL